MTKLFKSLTVLMISLVSATFTSCKDDDGAEPMNIPNGISEKTKDAIKLTFGNLRLDSIKSSSDFDNKKLTYSEGLLTSYKECYQNGEVHDGVYFLLKWTRDTVFISGGGSYKAVLGENGLVKELICPNGKVNAYSYDADGHLIKYQCDLVRDNDFWELTWENGNVVKARDNYDFDTFGNVKYYKDYQYDYDDRKNLAGLLPSVPWGQYNWINDRGKSVAYGINEVLYYAGILGRGTRNLPVKIHYKNPNSGHMETCAITYYTDADGYVTDAASSYDSECYFYIKP